MSDSACIRCVDTPCVSYDLTYGSTTIPQSLCDPFEAIQLTPSKAAVIDPDRCTGCGLCMLRCPVGAISYSGEVVAVAEASQHAPFEEVTGEQQHAHLNQLDLAWNLDSDGLADLRQRIIDSTLNMKAPGFYRLTARLFTIAGIPALPGNQGDGNNRMDLILPDTAASIPVEVKSPTEDPQINVKSVLQALENKIILDERHGESYPSKPEVSTLAIALDYPPERSIVEELVADIFASYGIRVGLVSLPDLVELAIEATTTARPVARDRLTNLLGSL